MCPVDWLDVAGWGGKVHVAENGSHVPNKLHEDDGGES
jgi:hypothetical protein